MDDIIIIREINFSYKNKVIFDKFNLNIKRGTWTTIIGPNGGGKSTLIKIMTGLLKLDGYVSIDNVVLDNNSRKHIISKMGVLFENPDFMFVAETVMDEMAFALENIGQDKEFIKNKVDEVSKYLKIEHLLTKNPHELSGGEKQMVALASVLVTDPSILLLDEALNRIDNYERTSILKLLKKINKEKKITIINITHDVEESIYGDDIVLLDQGKIILKGNKELVFMEEKVFNTIGLDIPFMAELSNKLKFYNLIDKMILDMDEMVEALWK